MSERMDPEIKKEWLEDLRSGKIPQGKGCLGKDTGERCCLGVLCDIAVEHKVIKPATVDDYRGDLIYDECRSLLPQSVRDFGWPGGILDSVQIDEITDRGTGYILSLADMNDKGFTFSQIADVIEYFL